MNFYEKMLIKVLEKSMSAQDSEILKKLKSGIDLSAKDKKELEELIDSLQLGGKMKFIYDRNKTAVIFGDREYSYKEIIKG